MAHKALKKATRKKYGTTTSAKAKRHIKSRSKGKKHQDKY